jgi:hypothetical protein
MRVLPQLVLGVLVFTSAPSRAEPLLKPPSPVPAPNDEPEPPLVPDAKDTLGGHLVLAASGAFVVPWGEFSDGLSTADLGPGYGIGADLGYGLSRSVVLGVWGQYNTYAESPDCALDPDAGDDDCTAMGFAVGPFVRYHLVQGMRFDPWLLAGVGYRALTVESRSGKADYSGFEWMRIAVGGDYYPLNTFGFGPIIELDAGVFGNRPSDDRGTSIHFTFVAGLRLLLDVPGK